MIFVFFTTLQATAQSPNIYDYGASYKVKAGDSNEYRYAAINYNGKNHMQSSFQTENGSYIPVNVTTKSSITITVLKIEKSTTGNNQVFVRTKLKNPGQSAMTNNNTNAGTFLIPAFDNQSIVKKFVSELSIYASNQNTDSPNTIQYSIEGNYIKIESSYNYNNIYSNNNYNYVSTNEVVYNWKNGWLEYTQTKQVAENGTVLINYKLQRISNNLINEAINYSITGLTIASLAAVIIVPMFTFYSYKKFAKSPKVANKNINFSQYIKSKGKKKPASKITSPTGSTKALDMIDEILKENK